MGPTVRVILKSPLKDTQRHAAWERIRKLSNQVADKDFWINDRPFLIHFSEDDEDEFSDLDYEDTIGWLPQGSICFSAGCNQPADHFELGQLALDFACIHNGLIDFGGDLGAAALDVDGKLWELLYEAASGKICVSHIGDTTFMKAWLKHKNFRMIK